MSTRNPAEGSFYWPSIQGVGGNTRPLFVSMSGVSKAIILSALDDAGNLRNWNGAGEFLTVGEADEIAAAVSLARLELMMPMMVGAIVPYMGTTEPEWGLFCDGRLMQRADYPELWEFSFPPYQTETTFYLPDFRGRVFVGTGQSALGGHAFNWLETGGEFRHTLTEAEMPTHSHTYTPPIPNVDLEAPGVPDVVAAGINPIPQSTGNAGGGQSHENMPPYVSLHYVIITPKP